MEYVKGSIGRVFTVRLDHGDDLLNELEGLARAENIRSALFLLLGAVREATLVVGPRENKVPPEVQWAGFQDTHEVVGIGNIFSENGNPKIHLHAAAGRGTEPKVGCLRGKSEIFMVAEVFILELTGINAERVLDANRGFAPVSFRK
ncbi:PPC domain-containing DNA-binding protein [Methanolobus chelungpuianus]|uniref:DNA-binding protein with PD1-like DNA-binding motif n=1 Tax=Methanolobus chelungpuianus TaxID=502115 RepID=A0AAE3KW49_9EURY|nr:PPC domain-containing DNA-binding protein [Methanolobus chelungpuianus]MCQ6961942.1 DNA-binding protein with PD1-like DNA-binding motif [Methanolobus chelungpuianus]